jgi:hypothetical protein
MPVDVTATGVIGRPREEVAAYLRDPANDTSWIGGLRSARLLTPAPVAVGSQVERVASFLGRRVEGDAGRFYALAAPLLGVAVRRSITRDLRNLKRVME